MRSLLRSSSIKIETLHTLLKQAQNFAVHAQSALPFTEKPLEGKTVCTLFYEASTRTRLSFEMAAMNLGARVLPFPLDQSSLNKGESLLDTVETLIALGVNALVLRHPQDGIHLELETQTQGRIAILNAGDGMSDHPTQGLLDVLTLFQQANGSFEALKQLRLGIVGDLKHSRVVTATVTLAKKLGVQTLIHAPDALAPSAETLAHWKKDLSVQDAPQELDLERLLANVDVVMALRLQKERLSATESPENLEALVQSVQIKASHLAQYPHVKVMHPGPVNWGVELEDEIRTHPQSLISQQVANGVAVRMACLLWALEK
jgi:aspartate carbamoyltransferase catalytic subunit